MKFCKAYCFYLTCFIINVLILHGCRSSSAVQNLSAEDLFERGKQKFENEDYLEAIDDFTAVTVQYPGSAVADDAEFYLADSRFQRDEYLLAAYEFETLKRNMPASPLVAQAQYKIGLCYYKLSPKPDLDQLNTKKAIDEFQNFLEYFPTHPLAHDAELKIIELNNRLAEKDYETAVLYMKMENYKSATLYFDNVLEKFHDSEYAERAHIGKVEALVARKKYNEAKVEVEKFLTKYPKSEYRSNIQSLENEIDRHLKEQSTTDSSPTTLHLSRQQ